MRMIRNFLYIMMLIFAINSNCIAEEWKYDLKDAYVSRKVGDKYEVTFNAAILDYYMVKIGPHAGLYPPVFKDGDERKFIEAQLKSLIDFLEVATNGKEKPELLWRYGWALAMGHNLDFPGSAEKKAIKTFDKVLSINPEHVRATYLYGVFLSTTTLRDKSISLLEKSIKNGINEAKRYLVPIYLSDESTRARGMKLLEEYVHDFPEDEQCKHLLKALKSSNVKIENVY